MSGSATDGNADFGDEDVLATERGDSMWRLYAEYGRTNWWRGAVGVLGTVVARILGLVPAFILGLALDAVVYDRRAYRLSFVPTDWIPTTQTGQLWLSVGLVVGSTAIAAGSTWVQNWGWNAFAQRVQHALRIDTYDAMQSLEMGFFDDRQTGQLLSVLSNDSVGSSVTSKPCSLRVR